MRAFRILSLAFLLLFGAASAYAEEAIVDDGSVVKVALTGNDSIQFNLKEIKVKAGRKIQLTLTHVGKGDIATMGHNFVLLKAGTDPMGFGIKASMARDTGFIPAEEKGNVIANTKTIAGGESVTIEFDAPPPGTYPYLCSFTGHFASMQGTFIVE